MVIVYWEYKGSFATVAGIFPDEDTYLACFTALEKEGKENNFDTITENVIDWMEINDLAKHALEKAREIEREEGIDYNRKNKLR